MIILVQEEEAIHQVVVLVVREVPLADLQVADLQAVDQELQVVQVEDSSLILYLKTPAATL